MQLYDLEKLSKISKKLKLRGKKIGLCHGVFDVIHAGHISHFEEVKKKCDYLFVTVTEDKFVSKGPNRPVNSHYFRAKVIAALKQVNGVGINFTGDAVKSIQAIKPDFYFKGKDYKGKKDLTLRLQKEKLAVVKNGGKIIFTESPLKSSTEIINKSFSYIFDSKLQKFLSTKNKSNLLNDTLKSLKRAENLNALIIGDAIIDQYDSVTPLNKPPKESILATRYNKSDIFLGGVFAAATNLSQFNTNVEICTVIGKDVDIKKKVNNFAKRIKSKIFIEKDKVTVRKKRFVEEGYNKKLCEVISTRINGIFSHDEAKHIQEMYMGVVGKSYVDAVEVLKNRHLHEFAFTFRFLPYGEELKEFNDGLSIAASKGYLDEVVAITAKNYARTNVKLALKYLGYHTAKSKKNIEESQMRLAENKSKNDAAAAKSKVQAELQSYKAKAGIDIEKAVQISKIKQAEFIAMQQAEQPFKEKAFEKELLLEQVRGGVKSELEAFREDRKDDRVKLEATQQSKMKDQVAPIDFTESGDSFDFDDILS